MGVGSGKPGSLESDTEVRELKDDTGQEYLLPLRFGKSGRREVFFDCLYREYSFKNRG